MRILDVYKTWTGVHGPPQGPGPWGPWTTPNFQKEMAPVKMEIYWRSGYEKQICVRRVKCHFTVTPVKYS